MLWLVAFIAFADVPPPPGYVESCTPAKACKKGQESASCNGWHGGREPCEALEKDGYVKACQTRGASTWTEVLCRDTAKTDPSPIPADPSATPAAEPGPTTSRRCDSTSGAGALAALGLLAARRRRSL